MLVDQCQQVRRARLLVVGLLMGVAWVPPSASDASMPLKSIDLTACDLRGRRLDLGHGSILPIPESGVSIGMARLDIEGEVTAKVTVTPDGTLSYERTSAAAFERRQAAPSTRTAADRTAASSDGCDFERAYVNDFEVDSSGLTYWVGDGVQPAGGTQADLAVAAKAAASTWRNQKSPCTTGDYTFVPELTYLGRLGRAVDSHSRDRSRSRSQASDRRRGLLPDNVRRRHRVRVQELQAEFGRWRRRLALGPLLGGDDHDLDASDI